MYSARSSYHSRNSDEARAVRLARENMFAGKAVSPAVVRPAVLDSWLRCQQIGVNPQLKAAPIILSREDAEHHRDDNTLAGVAAPILSLLSDALHGRSFLLLLADAACSPLEVRGSKPALGAADRINVVLGSQWSEEQVGTDALALSTLLDAPIQIHWYEHYSDLGKQWAGNSAPIHDPLTRELLGTISIYGYNDVAHPCALDVLTRAASMIENRLLALNRNERLRLFETYSRHLARFPDDCVLCLDRKGTVLTATSTALDILGFPPDRLLGRPLRNRLGVAVDQRFLSVGTPRPEAEIELNRYSGEHVRATLHPIEEERGTTGFLVRIKPPSHPKLERAGTRGWRAQFTFDSLVGAERIFLSCLADARRMATTDHAILIIGESGTGKELFAHAIHQASVRRNGPFVPLNCGGLNDELLAAELFGYEKGAFTGALPGGRRGKLELSHTGTLFLDEIEEMSPKMQVHLLRALEDQHVTRVGAEEPRRIDVRLIAATNIELQEAISAGRFRKDLYYRLNVLPLHLPPLRARKEDIPRLVKHLLEREQPGKALSDGALKMLGSYHWPGNVRELRNVLSQACLDVVGKTVTEQDLPDFLCSNLDRPANTVVTTNGSSSPEPGPATLKAAERDAIVQVLGQCEGNVSRAATRLGVHRVTLHRKMKRYGIARTPAYC